MKGDLVAKIESQALAQALGGQALLPLVRRWEFDKPVYALVLSEAQVQALLELVCAEVVIPDGGGYRVGQ